MYKCISIYVYVCVCMYIYIYIYIYIHTHMHIHIQLYVTSPWISSTLLYACVTVLFLDWCCLFAVCLLYYVSPWTSSTWGSWKIRIENKKSPWISSTWGGRNIGKYKQQNGRVGRWKTWNHGNAEKRKVGTTCQTCNNAIVETWTNGKAEKLKVSHLPMCPLRGSSQGAAWRWS